MVSCHSPHDQEKKKLRQRTVGTFQLSFVLETTIEGLSREIRMSSRRKIILTTGVKGQSRPRPPLAQTGCTEVLRSRALEPYGSGTSALPITHSSRPRSHSLATLCLHFLISKIGIIIAPSSVVDQVSMM